jgi:hypothetical protein
MIALPVGLSVIDLRAYLQVTGTRNPIPDASPMMLGDQTR